MASDLGPGDRVRVRTGASLVDGVIWSDGPQASTYWVIPDQPQPHMTQGCIQVTQAMMETTDDEALW